MLKKALSGMFSKTAGAAVPAAAMPQGPVPDAAGHEDADNWRDGILERFYQHMHRHESDNFDAERFAGQDPGVFQIRHPVQYLKFFFLNFIDLFEARNRLADAASKDLLDRLILFRMLSHHHVKVLEAPAEHWRLREQAKSFQVGSPQETGVLGQLGSYEFPFEGGRIRLDGWAMNVAMAFLMGQYYFDRDGVSIKPRRGDYLIDAGACFGDTALAFASTAGAEGQVYAFDMVPTHCRIMRRNLDMNPSLAGRITLFPCGVSAVDRNIGMTPAEDVGVNPAAHLDFDKYPVRRIDSLVDEGVVKRVDFIKMDIEGSELDALCGAEASLRRWRPRLAISIYHRPEDYFSIIRYLAMLDLGYRFYLDHYTIHGEETVLYASAEAPAA
ncbi:MAG: FkbM family methyltransferase [Burkholderiales bacterium]|nr:FkbM family methyltransferase [Burkholderiales bacterium]